MPVKKVEKYIMEIISPLSMSAPAPSEVTVAAAAAAVTATAAMLYSLLHNNKAKIDAIQTLVEAVLLVKINVLENSVQALEDATHVLEKTVHVLSSDHELLAADHQSLKEDLEKEPDTFQAWTGTFEYMLHGYYKIRGFIEIINTEVFTVKENKEWLASKVPGTRDQFVKKLTEMEKFSPKTWIMRTKDSCYLDWNGWNGTVTCRVKIYEGRDNFSRVEEALSKAPTISWERHLITHTK